MKILIDECLPDELRGTVAAMATSAKQFEEPDLRALIRAFPPSGTPLSAPERREICG